MVFDRCPPGSLQAFAHAGVDTVTKRPLGLKGTVPAGPNATQQAEKVRTRLLNQVDEKRNPRTVATVGQLLDKYMAVIDRAPSTRRGYDSKTRTHIRPLLGALPLARLDAEVLDSFYTEIRRCRLHCDGKPFVQHRTSVAHECDEHGDEPCSPPEPRRCRACRRACRPHVREGLDNSSVLQIHGILSGALKRARAWKRVSVNPSRMRRLPRSHAPTRSHLPPKRPPTRC